MDADESARIVGSIEAVDQFGKKHRLTVLADLQVREPPYKPGEGAACFMADGSPLTTICKGEYETIGSVRQLHLISNDPAAPGVAR